MPEDYYKRYRYSVTCQADDLAVVHCLRALCQYAEEASYKQIGWGGTGTNEWKAAGNQITLRFTKPVYREKFEQTADRLLPDGSWSVVRRNDKDPAQGQRA
mgnify:FL=1